MQIFDEMTKSICESSVLITALVAKLTLSCPAHLSNMGLQSWYCHSHVIPNVLQWGDSRKAHLTNIWCGKEKQNAHCPSVLPLHTKPEFSQCLSCKPQPQGLVGCHLDELVLFSSKCQCIKWIRHQVILSTVVWEVFLKGSSQGRDVLLKIWNHCGGSGVSSLTKIRHSFSKESAFPWSSYVTNMSCFGVNAVILFAKWGKCLSPH